MNAKKRYLVIAVLFVGLIMLNGCKKSEPAPSDTSADTMQEMQEHAAMMSESAKEVVSAIEQTDCPVMGGAINKAIFAEYKGKKVYFCCSPCEEKFKEEPEKYIAKLPQFNK